MKGRNICAFPDHFKNFKTDITSLFGNRLVAFDRHVRGERFQNARYHSTQVMTASCSSNHTSHADARTYSSA